MATILVTDGEQRSALAIVRSVGQAGHSCVVLSRSGRSLAGASRHAAHDVATPPASDDPERFASAVRDLASVHRADVILPVAEESVLALLPVRNTLGAVMPFPELATFKRICDKQHVLDVAKTLGIRVPAQTVVTSRREAVFLPAPAVLKPSRSVHVAADGTIVRTSVAWAGTVQEIEEALSAYPDGAYPVLVQEVISGPGIGVFVLIDSGRVAARFSHRRLLEKPPRGGVSVVSQAEPIDDALYSSTLALLEALEWSGVAMVEYKRDVSTGQNVLMEINGRFWGSLQLAVDAGVDFPRILVDIALGRTVEPVMSYGEARIRWEWGHVDHLWARCRQGSSRQRLSAISDWLRSFGLRSRTEVLRLDDPRPFLRESAQWFGKLRR